MSESDWSRDSAASRSSRGGSFKFPLYIAARELLLQRLPRGLHADATAGE